MKYTYITLCLSLLLLSLAGCKQDEMQSLRQSDTRLTSVKATTSAAVKSRTQLSGNAVIWEQSDAIPFRKRNGCEWGRVLCFLSL